jgi:hypothetical protein
MRLSEWAVYAHTFSEDKFCGIVAHSLCVEDTRFAKVQVRHRKEIPDLFECAYVNDQQDESPRGKRRDQPVHVCAAQFQPPGDSCTQSVGQYLYNVVIRW